MIPKSTLTNEQIEMIAGETHVSTEVVRQVASNTDLVRRTMNENNSSEYETVAWLVFDMTDRGE